jgi:tetratricopeptide (TPR) repeat protein
LWGRCDPELGLPYQPFVEILTHYARFAAPELLAQHRAQYGRELARLVPELGGVATAPAALAVQPRDDNRHVMFAAVAGLLRTAALQRPLVLVLDDLQWADRPTLLLLKYLLVYPQLPALVVGTYRSSEAPREHPLSELVTELRRRPGFEHIELSGLGPDQCVAMAQDLAQESLDAAGVEFVYALGEATDGNPFFLGEIVRSLKETGGVARAVERRDAVEDRGARDSSALGIPRSVRDAIARRVSTMGDRAEHALCAAAVIGREFDVELLARMLSVQEDELVDVLDTAAEAALISEVPGIGMRYSFVHPLIPPALYEQLGGGARTYAGDWERRKALSDESVAIAGRLGDPETITKVLSARFITIWTPETLAERIADTERGLAIAEELGDPLAVFQAAHWKAAAAVEAGNIDLAAELLQRESELAERLRRPVSQWLAAYDRSTQALMHGLLDEAERSAEDAWRIATDSEQPEALAFYAGQLINIRFEQGRLHELEPLIAQQVEANPRIPAFRGALVLARSEAGMRAEALEVLAVDAATDFSRIAYDSNWLAGIAIYAQACGSLEEPDAAAKLHRLLAPWRDHVAFNSATIWGLVERLLGNLDRVLGRHDDAERALLAAAGRHEQMGAPIWLARNRVDLARLLVERATQPDRARALLEQALGTARDLGCAGIERHAVELLGQVEELS